MSSLARFQLRLLGGATLLGADGGALAGRAVHRHRVALLALLALARPNGMSREKVIGLLWPERDSTAARGLLRAALHELRHALGPAAIEAVGDDLHLDASRLRVDVHAFEDALARGDREGAVALYRGPFLDGLFLDDAEAFEEWVTAERARLARRHEEALEALAAAAERDGAAARAAQWWSALAARRPGDGRVALHTMEALAAAGDRAGALALADAHGALLRTEFGAAPDAAVVACAARLREREPGADVRTAVARGSAAQYTAAVDVASLDAVGVAGAQRARDAEPVTEAACSAGAHAGAEPPAAAMAECATRERVAPERGARADVALERRTADGSAPGVGASGVRAPGGRAGGSRARGSRARGSRARGSRAGG